MFKKTISLCLILILALNLTACGHEHEWADANCTTPKTCTSCEETEGEALGHNWMDASCTAPKTCSVCDATEGDALEHTWLEANHQQPKTCSVCAATEGEALVTYFEEHGLDAKILDKSGQYELPVTCYQNKNKNTIAKVTVEDYKTITSDETHEALQGYEWRVMTLKLLFDDEKAQKYGFMGYNYLWGNRYEEAIADQDEDSEDDGIIDELFTTGMKQTFVWHGVEYEDGLLHIGESSTGWVTNEETGSLYLEITVTVSIRVPVGHDEFVLGLENSDWEWPDGTYLHEVITDNTLMFRFD